MSFPTKEVYHIEQCHLEVLGMKHDLIEKYPYVEKGYLFHFYYGDHSIIRRSETQTKFSVDFHWKISFPGNLPNLKNRLEKFKNNLVEHRKTLVNEVDQFAYLFLFIVKTDNMYELVISTDDLSFDTITSIINEE